MSKVVLLNTAFNNESENRFDTYPPLGLLYIASSLIKAGFEVAFIDPQTDVDYMDTIDREIIDGSPLYVGFTTFMGDNIKNFLRLTKYINDRVPDVPIVCGGPLATSAPELCFEEAPVDLIVMGMGEECAVQIAERIQNGGDLATIPYVSSNINNKIDIKDTYYFKGELDDLSYPALHLWEDGIKLMKTIPILSSRGCPYACSFCYNNQFTGRRKWYARSTQSVIDELAYWSEYFNTKEFYFVDDNMLLHTKRACDILEATLEVGYKLDQVIANLNDYKPPIVKYVIDNNVNAVMFAIESASPKIQKVLGKRQDLEKAKHIVRRFTEANINQIATNFMFGLPSEEDEDIKANIDMAYELRKINSNFRSIPYIYTPQPDDDIIKKFEFFKDVKFTYDALSTVDMSPNRTNYLTLQTRPWLTQNDIEFYLDFVLVWFYHFDHLVRSSQNIDVEAILKGNKRLGALFSDIPLPEKPSQIEVQNLAIIASTQAEMPGFRAPTE